MELQIVDVSDQASQDMVSVSDEVFAQDFNEGLVHQIVVAYLADARAGTRAQKSRSQARGGGAKPWRQKGTGRARAGTIRSPIWRAGGVTFAARPQDHSKKVNKKMYRAAMRAIFSELVRQQRLLIVNQLLLSEPKTKLLKARLAEFGITDQSVLFITENNDMNLQLAARNLPKIEVLECTALDPVSLIRCDKVIITAAALAAVGERLA